MKKDAERDWSVFIHPQWWFSEFRQKKVEQTNTHSPFLVHRWCPQQQAWTWSHNGALFYGTTTIYRCPGGYKHTESTVKDEPTPAGNPSTSLACTSPRWPLVSTATANQLSQQIKKPVKINHCAAQKKHAIIIAFCFFPQYNDNNGWWGVGRPATAGRRPDCIWQTVRESRGLQKLATLDSGSPGS